MNAKQHAAEAALQYVESGMTVGLGTGSTSDFFLQALGRALRDGNLRDVRGVPTSLKTAQRSRELGIALTSLADCPLLDLCVDGADEVGPGLGLIKGLGGALLREKIIAQNSRRFIVIADARKRVSVLGSRSPLPVEVAQFSHEVHVPFFQKLGAEPTLRRGRDGDIFVTDNGNYIYDLRFSGIDDPAGLQQALLQRAGVVETGLFLRMAEVALISDGAAVQELRP